MSEEYYRTLLKKGKTMDELIEKHGPTMMRPCSLVGAKKLKELPDFEEKCRGWLEEKKAEAAKERLREEHVNEAFCEYWEKQTLKKLMKKDAIS